MKLVTTKFKSEGLHEKHVVATWNFGNHLISSQEFIFMSAIIIYIYSFCNSTPIFDLHQK